MKRLHHILLLSLALSGTALTAQNKDTADADKLYNRLEYVDAADAYLKLVDRGKGDAYVYRQLAESYYNVFNSKEAARWYAKATESQQDAETYFRYAQMLKAEGQYEKANAQMARFAQLAPSDDRAKEYRSDPDYLPKLRAQGKLFQDKALAINSDKSDFGPFLTDDGHLYFASARNKARRTYGWNEEPFLDLYVSVMNADGSLAEPTPVAGVNTRFHEGPASITKDGSTMYFSSESFKEGEFEKDKKNRLKMGQTYLYRATRDGESWGGVKELGFNGRDYSNKDAAISPDGKTLYFSSNMPGGSGGYDIWKVSVSPEGTYGTPENLGTGVNTAGNEGFPSLTESGRLYFSSDARQGFGGLDVFYVDTRTGGEARNVGAPVNTSRDDFAFSFNETRKTGFFSSNRNGNDDLFQATPVCATEITVAVTDARTGAALPDARVAILDEKKNVVETKTSDAGGLVSYVTDCGRTFAVQATRQGYESATFPVARTAGEPLSVSAALQPIETIVKPEEVTLNEIRFEYDRSNITREGAFELDKLVQVLAKYPNMTVMVKAHTDNRGSDAYNMALSERRARSTVQYVLSKGVKRERISGKGFGESEPKVDCGADCTEEQHAQNRRSEFLIVKQ
ncbi:MAG: cell envelope biogenesis protein OmpA [Gammaproteobacteria bacterium]|nr:MAG: cell envelope biogenesis protein OmpA [Gammaproteobacteria bacterium]